MGKHKHEQYKQEHSMYEEAEHAIAGALAAEKFESTKQVAERYNNRRRMRRRIGLPRDLRCPRCAAQKLDTRQWNIKLRLCVACAQSKKGGLNESERIQLVEAWKTFAPAVSKGRIDGAVLRSIRSKLGISRSTFATRCGWERTRQAKLETKVSKRAHPRTRAVILAALEQYFEAQSVWRFWS